MNIQGEDKQYFPSVLCSFVLYEMVLNFEPLRSVVIPVKSIKQFFAVVVLLF